MSLVFAGGSITDVGIEAMEEDAPANEALSVDNADLIACRIDPDNADAVSEGCWGMAIVETGNCP